MSPLNLQFILVFAGGTMLGTAIGFLAAIFFRSAARDPEAEAEPEPEEATGLSPDQIDYASLIGTRMAGQPLIMTHKEFGDDKPMIVEIVGGPLSPKEIDAVLAAIRDRQRRRDDSSAAALDAMLRGRPSIRPR